MSKSMIVSIATAMSLLVAVQGQAQQKDPQPSAAPAIGNHAGHQDHTAPASSSSAPTMPSDERAVVELDVAQRDFVLHEMRDFLVSIKNIVAAMAKGDMAQLANSAKASGIATTQHVPRELMRKMPVGWRELGMDTHQRFDDMALEAASLGDREQLLEKLSGILANCTACHAAYRLQAR